MYFTTEGQIIAKRVSITPEELSTAIYQIQGQDNVQNICITYFTGTGSLGITVDRTNVDSQHWVISDVSQNSYDQLWTEFRTLTKINIGAITSKALPIRKPRR